MVAIMLGADNGFFYAGQVMHFSSPFTVFLIYHKQRKGVKGMRVWLYYRLSRDEDKQFNSLKNQYSIIESYALNNGHTIVGSSFDDNVSGMHFNRAGIDELTEAVENGMIDAVIVKDYCAIIGLNQKDLENQGILA